MPDFTIRAATEGDIPVMIALERDAAQAFRDIGYDFCADGETRGAEEHKRGMRDGAVFIAEMNAGLPAGFILLWSVDGHAHITEVSVGLRFQKMGIGKALINRAEAWAKAAGHSTMTLTTFRDVSWNAPFYRSIGYEEFAPSPKDLELAAVIETEAAFGFDTKPRVTMKKVLGE